MSENSSDGMDLDYVLLAGVLAGTMTADHDRSRYGDITYCETISYGDWSPVAAAECQRISIREAGRGRMICHTELREQKKNAARDTR
jgi:hypothetical protein